MYSTAVKTDLCYSKLYLKNGCKSIPWPVYAFRNSPLLYQGIKSISYPLEIGKIFLTVLMNRMQWKQCCRSPDTRSQIAEELPPDSFSFGMLDLGTQQPCCEEVKQPYGKTTYKCLATALATWISRQSSSIRTVSDWVFWWLLTPVFEPSQLIHSESEQCYPHWALAKVHISEQNRYCH